MYFLRTAAVVRAKLAKCILAACEKMRKCKTHISRASDVLIVFLMDFSVVSDVSGVIWEEWWTYDGISGESYFFIK